MAPPAESGLGDGSLTKLEQIDRMVVKAATVTSAVYASLIVVIAAFVGDAEIVQRALGPCLVFCIGATQLGLRKPHAVALLSVSSIVVVAHTAVIGRDPTALLGLLAMAITGVLLVQQRVYVYVVAAGSTLYLLGIWWSAPPLSFTQKLLTSIGPTLLFVFTAVLVHWMRREMEAGRLRYQNLFYRTPVAIWEVDFSGVGRWLDSRRAEGVTDIRDYLEANPGVVAEAAGLAWVLDVNDAGVAFTGASSREALLGAMGVRELPEGYRSALVEQLAAIWEGRSVCRSELFVVRPDGTRVEGALVTSAPVRNGALDLTRVVTTVTDVTERNRSERRLQELVNSKDELVASVSHEVRTPLTAVVGLAEELRDRYAEFDPTEVQELVAVVADQSTEVAHIIDDLLVAARKDLGSLRLDVRRVDLRQEVAALASAGKAPVAVHIDLTDAVPQTQADPARLRQVLRNLLVNAERYGGGSTRVRIWYSADHSVVEVRDAGAPIPPQERESIFDPYYRARQVNGLTASVGLGLTISRQLARLMGGDVTYDHDGTESIFAVTLPNAPCDQPIEESTSARVGVPVTASS